MNVDSKESLVESLIRADAYLSARIKHGLPLSIDDMFSIRLLIKRVFDLKLVNREG